MAKKNTNLRSSRPKAAKPVDPKASPFKKELKNDRNKKAIVIGVVIIVVVMVGSLIVPYLGGQKSSYTLPETALKADETIDDSEKFNAQQISVGQTFNRSEKEYIVIFGNATNTSELAAKITKNAVYTVDSDKFVNRSLTSDIKKGKDKPTQPSEIKIKKDAALIKIKEGKVVEFFNTKTEVEKFIKSIK